MIKSASLTDIQLAVIQNKGTERPFSGEYDDAGDSGTYLCRQCGQALFRSKTKFHSGCGWPSFDEEIPGAVERIADHDGLRTEILCARCDGHLGHVFQGEGFTDKNTRHCVNSISLDFVENETVQDTAEAIFAAGCFWGVEHYLKLLKEVLKTEVGYTGGQQKDLSYEQVCSGHTGHYEAVRVVFDVNVLSYAQLVQYFFEIHDPSNLHGQGPDIGTQYLSAIFYYDHDQQKTAQEVIAELKGLGHPVATHVLPVSTFYRAEAYHQDYYMKNRKLPYCHKYTKKFQ